LTFRLWLPASFHALPSTKKTSPIRSATRATAAQSEEGADKIIPGYRDAYYAEREPEESDTSKEMERRERASSRLVEADVAKNRQGALGKVKLRGDMACNSFEDWD